MNKDKFIYSDLYKKSNGMWRVHITYRLMPSILVMSVERRTKKDLEKFIREHKKAEVL